VSAGTTAGPSDCWDKGRCIFPRRTDAAVLRYDVVPGCPHQQSSRNRYRMARLEICSARHDQCTTGRVCSSSVPRCRGTLYHGTMTNRLGNRSIGTLLSRAEFSDGSGLRETPQTELTRLGYAFGTLLPACLAVVVGFQPVENVGNASEQCIR